MNSTNRSLLLGLLLLVSLKSFAQVDSVKVTAYTYDRFGSGFTVTKVDTMLDGFQSYHPVYKRSILPSFTGNLGSPATIDIVKDRSLHDEGFLFAQPYQSYFRLPGEVQYYLVQQPYTKVDYMMGGPKRKQEQILSVVHTQNVNKDLNVGVNFDVFSGEGQYIRQRTSLRDFLLFSSYSGKRYAFHGNASFKSLRFQENGGIRSDSTFEATDLATEAYDVWLNDAFSKGGNRKVYFSQSYYIPAQREQKDTLDTLDSLQIVKPAPSRGLAKIISGATIYHTFQWDHNHRVYQNVLSGGTSLVPDRDFYTDIFIDSLSTMDSSFYRAMINSLHIEVLENPDFAVPFGLRAGIRNNLTKHGHTMIPDSLFAGSDTIVNDFHTRTYFNTRLFAGIFNRTGNKFTWAINGYLGLTGYELGDFLLEGEMVKHFPALKYNPGLHLSFSQSNKMPDYFHTSYTSNHFIWRRDLLPENQSILSGKISMDKGWEIGMQFVLWANQVYFNQDAIADQNRGTFTLASGWLKQNTRMGKFGFDNEVVYQKSSSEISTRVPEVVVKHILFFEQSIVRNVLIAQIGYELYYNSAYYANAYMPATGVFHVQDEKKTGNYPYLNVFLNAKLKRTRFFLKYDHVHSGYIPKNYYMIPHYPMNERVFKFGLSWTFYD